jgi:uncharacterized protein with WD repeat
MRIWALDACLKVGITFRSTDNKRTLGTITSVNMFGITKSTWGCSVENETVFSSTVEDTIVPIFFFLVKFCDDVEMAKKEGSR